MQHSFEDPSKTFDDIIQREIDFLQKVGSNQKIFYAYANPGAYLALLHIIANKTGGMPVYSALEKASAFPSSISGVSNRLKIMRQMGVLSEMQGVKKTQICLSPSNEFLEEFAALICDRAKTCHL